MKNFQDKVAVVTGAGSGIGRALARNLAHKGAKLALCDVKAQALGDTVERIKKECKDAQPIFAKELDVSKQDEVYAFADEVASRQGAASLVINNAGVAQVAAVQELSLADLEWVMAVNFWGVVYGTQAFLPQMLKAASGHIVNISSVFGLVGVPRQAAYCSAKFAVLGYTESLRHDMRELGVDVSVVHPGGIKTNIAKAARHNQGPDIEERRRVMTERFDEFVRTTPEKAAEVIIKGVMKKRARILIGSDARQIDRIRRLLPASYPRLLAFTRGDDESASFDGQ